MTASGHANAALVRGPLLEVRRSGIRETMDLAASLEGVLHLELGEPDFATPAHIVEVSRTGFGGDRFSWFPSSWW